MTTVTSQKHRPAHPLLELSGPLEMGLFAAASLLPRRPKGRKQSVLVLPGFVASDMSTIPLRASLRRLGHRAVGWKLGRNLGPTKAIFDGIHRRLDEEAQHAQHPVTVVGWSLGGVYARLLAQERPDLVHQVISLGSPFNIGASDRTTVSPLWDALHSRGEFVRDRESLDLDEIPVPSTSIYTTTDGVVSWQSCIQTEHDHAENTRVYGSHCGLGVNVAAATVIADRLAQPRNHWRPFEPSGAMARLFPAEPDQ